MSTPLPRVSAIVLTYNFEDYIAESIESVLAQDYPPELLEVIVVDDGSTDRTRDAIAPYLDRVRYIHKENGGLLSSVNRGFAEATGELIAIQSGDDMWTPRKLALQVEILRTRPEVGLVYGDMRVVDAAGRELHPSWMAMSNVTPHSGRPTGALLRGNFVSGGTVIVRSSLRTRFHPLPDHAVWEDWWIAVRVNEVAELAYLPTPLLDYRYHGANMSLGVEGEALIANKARELPFRRWLLMDLDLEGATPEDLLVACALYEQCVAAASHRRGMPPAELLDRMPEQTREAIRWATRAESALAAGQLLQAAKAVARAIGHDALDPAVRRARAAAVEQVQAQVPAPSVSPEKPDRRPRTLVAARGRNGHRLMMTAFGWNDSGGGTTVPRLAAKELARRGWEVTVFHAATKPTESGIPYEVVESEEDGVRLLAVHNRAHGIWDLGNPLRELDDPPITAAFAAALDRVRPNVVHFHNLHNLGAALIDQAATRGIPSYFSTHNYWLMCPRAYLMTGSGEICPGPGDGTKCATCVQSPETEAHRLRFDGIRARVSRGVTACLTVSDAVRRTLLGAGYPAEMLDVVRQGMPHDTEIWERLGRDRAPGRRGESLTAAFLGSAYPHKGPQLLVAAAQGAQAEVKVQIYGEVPPAFAKQLKEADRRGVVELCGAFQPSEIHRVLAGVDVAALPSIWWDCAPLAAAECLAARVPVLAPRLGGLAEAVEHEVNGLLFDALDADDLARCLDRLDREAGLLENLQSNIQAPRLFSAYVDELEAYYAGERPGRVADPPVGGARAVRWHGDHGLCTSLSIVNARLTERLATVQRVSREGRPLDPPLPHAADVEVRHRWPPDLTPPDSGRLAVIQPWEFGSIPSEWVAPLEANVDELWVPSEFVRRMYLDAGILPERVVSVPNGVDLERFSPDGEQSTLPTVAVAPGVMRFLFVGGLIWRKGPDVLLAAWKAAFPEREDVVLIVKDVGVSGVYRDGDREGIVEHVASGALPRMVLVDDEFDEEELARLYRTCDVLVHPYRGEGFAMPVLEAMACGTPPILTEGGPTDEFCPPDAGWRIRSSRAEFPADRVGAYDTVGRPWVLEPDPTHLARLLREVQGSPMEVSRRGAAARAAAERYGWDEIAGRYRARMVALMEGDSHARESRIFEEDVALRLLATPAWRGGDRLDELLRAWGVATTQATSACLYLLADPHVDGSQEELHARVLAAGVDLEGAADINVLMESIDGDGDLSLHEGVDAFVVLHDACEGHARMARAAGTRIVRLAEGEIERLIREERDVLAPA